MTDANEKRLAELERRIAELEKYKSEIESAQYPRYICEIAVKLEAQDKRNKDIFDSLMAHQKCFDVYHDSLNDIRCDLTRLMQAYYRVFPERIDQDLKFSAQLRKLNSSDDPNSKD